MKIIFSMLATMVAAFVMTGPVFADSEDPPTVCQEGQTENCVLLE